MSIKNMPQTADIFISYASEDREDVAKPLAGLLQKLGVNVWFDQTELKLGDRLRRRIDEGLANCQFGVVILSKHFFEKHYTQLELDGLAQRETNGAKVILPIWVGIDEELIRRYSPTLADRIAAKWEEGIGAVVTKILEASRPDILKAEQDRLSKLVYGRLRSGRDVLSIIEDAYLYQFDHDEPRSERESSLVSAFLQNLQDLGDIWDCMEIGDRSSQEYRITEDIREIERFGWAVFGRRDKGEWSLPNERLPISIARIHLARLSPTADV